MLRWFFLILFLLAGGLSGYRARGAEVDDTAGAVEKREGVLQLMQRQLLAVDELLAECNARDATTGTTTEPGMASTLRRANLYSAERETRRRLAEELAALRRLTTEMMAAYEAEGDALRAEIKALELLERPRPVARHAEEQAPQDDPENANGFSYHQVREPATLPELAALPEVYGDPGMWRLLLNSNPGLEIDDKTKVQPGTVLVVPNLLVVREQESDGSAAN